MSPPVTLTLKTEKQSFCLAPWLMMIHHNPKFGLKRLNHFHKISSRQTFSEVLNNCYDLDHTKAVLSLDHLAYNDILLTIRVSLVAKESAVQKLQKKLCFDYNYEP